MPGGGYDLDEIRRRADIVEIISPHVALRRRSGGRQLTGLCPFHQERTPSFSVDPEKGLWHCFGCKAGGDIFDFVEQIEKVTFAEAVELLGRRYGLQPRAPDGGARQHQKERLLELHAQACELFQQWLKPARAARDYLTTRGLTPAAITEFRLGYAPESWDSLLNAMTTRGFKAEELASAGLVVAREGRHYDRFRDRVIFPIWDTSGRVIAFGGRAMGDDNPPKYLNSPETQLFSKGRVLYAFDRARRAMDEAGRAIVVEGYLDAIACHEAGFRETAATMGTALTAEHVQMLRRRATQIVLAFDADSAGMGAALRSRELFRQAELAVRVLSLPEKVDPDELIRTQGAEAFAARLEAAVPLVEWELGRILARGEGVKEDARVAIFQEAVAALTALPSGVEREYYTRWLAQRWAPNDASQTASMEQAIRAEFTRFAARRAGPGQRREGGASESPVPERSPAKPAVGHSTEADLLAAFVHYGKLAPPHVQALEEADFEGEAGRLIFAAIRGLVEAGQQVTPQAVMAGLDESAHAHLADLAMRQVPAERVQETMEGYLRRLVERRLQRRRDGLLRRLETVGPGSEQEALAAELNECNERLGKFLSRRIVG